jgi:VCBS repeat protein/FG-GAP repeat protein
MMFRNRLARVALPACLLVAAACPASASAVDFLDPLYYPAGDPVSDHALQDIAVGNFNGGSDPDIAVVHQDKDRVQVFLGSTGATFTGPTNYTLFSHANPLGVAVGDFNGDGDSDLAVADEGSSDDNPQTTPGRVSVLLGSTGGTFTAPINYNAGFKPQAIAIADFNGDFDPDLAVANQGSEPGQGTSPGSVSVLLGGTGGTFGAATPYNAGLVLRDIGTGDFNGDSDPDLAVVNQGNGSSGSQQISILLGSSSGTFTGPTNYSPTAGCAGAPEAVGIADFNGDSDPDLAVANETCPSLVVMLGNPTNGSFGAATSFGTGSAPKDVGIGEFNDDSDVDLVVPNHGSHNVSVLMGGSAGSFTGPTNFNVVSIPATPTADGPAGVAIDDFNADGYLDFAVANDNTSYLAVFPGMRPYERPIGATPLRVPLVPAFGACSSANSTHGQPLRFQSCSPPSPASSTVKVGSGSVGYAQILVCSTGAAPAPCHESAPGFTTSMQPDVRLWGSGRNVQCRLTATPAGCNTGQDYNPNGAAGPYTTICATAASCGDSAVKGNPFCAPGAGSSTACIAGTDITAVAGLGQPSGTTVDPTAQCGSDPTCLAFASKFVGHGVRVTDTYNCKPGLGAGDPNACPAAAATSTREGTLVDIQFPVPVDCLPDAEAGITGSNCGVNTTANALVPGSVIAGKKAVVEIGEVQLLDSGPDGTRANPDDQRFATQGIFIP